MVTNDNNEKVQMMMKKRLGVVLSVLVLVVFMFIIGGKEIVGDEMKNTETEALGTESTEGTEVVDVTETTESTEVEEEINEYADLAIADVRNYVNVRTEPSTDGDIVGKIYDGSVAQILGIEGEGDDMWFKIISGNCEGYIKAEFFIYGNAAAEVIDEYVTRYIEVTCTRLNVRKEPTTESKRIGYVDFEERLEILEMGDEWIKVKYSDEKNGYVCADYVIIVEEFTYGKTLEEERAELEALRELEEREEEEESSSKENTTINVQPPSTMYSSNEELRRAIIDYAMQYLGHRYVHGGQSLASGTDCSGFTKYVLAEFGYSISRTPQGQYTGAGRAIDYSQVQPGDIICYSSNGGRSCTHVGFYIGNGQILHASNSRDGVKISSATYDDIYGVRNVID